MLKQKVAILLLFAIITIAFPEPTLATGTQTLPEKTHFKIESRENIVEISRGNQVVAKILPPEFLNTTSAKKEESFSVNIPFIENGSIHWKFEKSEPSDISFLTVGKNKVLKLDFHTLNVFYKITSPPIFLKGRISICST
ncbi:hypothetical protein [Caldicellulosiruptor naganoensis]|uniref:Uncharacterized protein n=1 Tax=Caldicellulosiruptor naganoensis TaxID=29324 RepID=A0ABY7BHJ6_9FIRM|nr:hypothetical protein [Caldicellulosiruptor naganoensis]WAM31352.1 hypothetical protein OTJ99_002202 [Caldicellulosiruptor naganoensis]